MRKDGVECTRLFRRSALARWDVQLFFRVCTYINSIWERGGGRAGEGARGPGGGKTCMYVKRNITFVGRGQRNSCKTDVPGPLADFYDTIGSGVRMPGAFSAVVPALYTAMYPRYLGLYR